MSYLDFSNQDEFCYADAKYVDDFSPVVNGGWRKAPPSAWWLERCGITHKQIASIREDIANGMSCRSIVHATKIPLNIIQWIRDGRHPDFPGKVVVPEHLKPKKGRKRHGENAVLDQYRREFTKEQEDAIIDTCKAIAIDGEDYIEIKFPPFVLPPKWFPATVGTDIGGKNNNFFYSLTRKFPVAKILKAYVREGKLNVSEDEIDLLIKQAKKLKEKFK